MAKRNSTLTDRATRIKPEYAPLQAPPNPHDDEARKALMNYGAQLLHNPQRVVEDAPEPEPEPQDEQSLIAACLARWPDLARYAATARVETMYDVCRDEQRGLVTITVWER